MGSMWIALADEERLSSIDEIGLIGWDEVDRMKSLRLRLRKLRVHARHRNAERDGEQPCQ